MERDRLSLAGCLRGRHVRPNIPAAGARIAAARVAASDADRAASVGAVAAAYEEWKSLAARGAPQRGDSAHRARRDGPATFRYPRRDYHRKHWVLRLNSSL